MSPLRVLVMAEGDAWVAQALERDVAGKGGSRDEAMDNLTIAMAIEVTLGAAPPAAPRPYHVAWLWSSTPYLAPGHPWFDVRVGAPMRVVA